MSTTDARASDASGLASVKDVDLKFEAVVIPVADVDRAKGFYGGLGWRLDADFPFENGFRVVQFTPPGSGCSVQFGTNITSAPPPAPTPFMKRYSENSPRPLVWSPASRYRDANR